MCALPPPKKSVGIDCWRKPSTGLDRALDTATTPATVFAPTNAAIAAAGIDPRDTMTAAGILENHIVLGSRLATPLAAAETRETLFGAVR